MPTLEILFMREKPPICSCHVVLPAALSGTVAGLAHFGHLMASGIEAILSIVVENLRHVIGCIILLLRPMVDLFNNSQELWS